MSNLTHNQDSSKWAGKKGWLIYHKHNGSTRGVYTSKAKLANTLRRLGKMYTTIETEIFS